MRNIIYLLSLTAFLIGSPVVKGQADNTQKITDWLPKNEALLSGSLQVPENHDDPTGHKIQISYVIIKAKDKDSAGYPMIYFSGGPGGKTIGQGMVNFLMQNPMRNNRDIILFDQRGIGYSSGLPDMSSAAFEILAEDANEARELDLMAKMIVEYKKKCKNLNIHPEYYNSFQNARDVGMLFDHLGYEKYNLMGGSYGTRLARIVQDMFPEYVYSSVLDSPAPLSGDFLLNRLDSYSLALSRIFDYCKTDSLCSSKYPKLKNDYFMAISGLGKKPLKTTFDDSTDVYINAQDGIYLLRRLLYQGNSREKAPELIKAYLNGEGEVINQVLQAEYQLTSGLNLSMLLSVEKYENFNLANTAEIIYEHYQKYPLVPTKMGFFDAFYQAGMQWHNNNMPLADRKFNKSDIPTIIFVNQFDPVTPPKNGYIFMEHLTNGKLLILDEGGHGAGNQQCKNEVIDQFMSNPYAQLDLSCLNLYKN